MPELPEVETIVRALRRELEGRRIARFESYWPRQCSPSVAGVRRAIVGRTIARVWRRAKFVVLDLTGSGQAPVGHLLVHLRMSGRLEWAEPGVAGVSAREAVASAGRVGRTPLQATATAQEQWHAGPTVASGSRGGRTRWRATATAHEQWHTGSARREPRPPELAPHVRAVWDFDDDRRLWFVDSRKFGRIIYARDLARITAALGVEPLGRGFTRGALERILRSRRRLLKPLLLDQSVIAGLGNIYADEALYRACIHPLAHSNEVSDEQVATLRQAIRHVLRKAIRHNGTTIDWIYPAGRMQHHLRVYGRAGRPCRRCGTPIVALRVGQRGTHICPRCQRVGGGRGRQPQRHSAALGRNQMQPPRRRGGRERREDRWVSVEMTREGGGCGRKGAERQNRGVQRVVSGARSGILAQGLET